MRAQAGTSAGPDGWQGKEVASALFTAATFAHLTAEFEAMACLPTQWADMRQTHLPKELPSEEMPGALPDDKFRPISVTSAWHRTWASAWFKSECCSSWLNDWWDNDMVGARRHREAAEAVVMAATSTNCNAYCTS